jgi:threonine dehydrogenase-like Zn-dependent dehydrogenase
MQTMGVDAFDTVLIAGMGPVGLGGVINATYRGARVIAREGHPYRRKLAERLGAAAVIDPGDSQALETVRELTGGRGVDKAIDCAGVPAAQRLLIDATRRKGRAAFIAEAGGLEIKVSDDMLRKGLTLHGCWHWNLGDTPRIMQVIRGCGAKLDQLITHTFPMREVRQAWDLQLTGDCGKVLLRPWAL